MYINNELRDLVYRNNLQHGFWDNIRSYDEFVNNLLGELQEAEEELTSGRKPTEVYFEKGNKPEGAPTELADIIIFILDYFGGSEPQIDVDEVFLQTPDKYYKNFEHYEKARKIEPRKYFIDIKKACRNHISMSAFHHLLHGNELYVDESGRPRSVSMELHAVIKLVLEFCDIYGIDMERELIDKINYNNTRPKDYRKMGQAELLETDPNKVFRTLLSKGWGMYKETDSVVAERQKINNTVLRKRKAREELESGEKTGNEEGESRE